jgi:hypothetical protein
MVAVRAADLASPARVGVGSDGRTALTAAGAGPIRSGDVVVFCKPVAVAAAVVRRDGRVQAAGHLADHARLGVAEQQLDALTGTPGLIDQLAASVRLCGEVKGVARRAMSPALVIRLVVLMTLMPDADYAEVMAALLGDLVAVPWAGPYRAPTATVVCTWRAAVGAAPLEQLRDALLAAADAGHRAHAGDYRAVTVGALEVCAIDGSLVRTPDSPANREALGSAGTAEHAHHPPSLSVQHHTNHTAASFIDHHQPDHPELHGIGAIPGSVRGPDRAGQARSWSPPHRLGGGGSSRLGPHRRAAPGVDPRAGRRGPGYEAGPQPGRAGDLRRDADRGNPAGRRLELPSKEET